MEEKIYDLFKELQFTFWWFNGRRKIIEAFMGCNVSMNNAEILDIGSGYGGLLSTLRKFGVVDAIEPHTEAHTSLYKLGVRNISGAGLFPTTYPEQKYDIVTMFDVLEHIKDDALALSVIKEHLLKPNGHCFLTVPAYTWLWTELDYRSGHFRRYTLQSLRELLQKVGFRRIKISYFMCFLFPVDLLSRSFQKLNSCHHMDLESVDVGPTTNKILESLFVFESKCIPRLRFPYGSSIIANAEM